MSEYNDIISEILYLVGTILFIVGLKKMSNPKTARSGNMIGAVGMGIGILIILLVPIQNATNNYLLIFIALALGSIIGYFASVKVALTAMPEMVSLFNGFGGGCSMFIGFTELYKISSGVTFASSSLIILTGIFAVFVGGITLVGSFVAWGKLSGALRDKIRLPIPQLINLIVLVACVYVGIQIMISPAISLSYLLILMFVSMVYGFTFVTPIGGGDMPVVISLLNSFSGIAAAISGLLYGNNFMIIGGILVGASGTILTVLMCQAMNRSIVNVLIGGFGAKSSVSDDGDKSITEITYSDLAVQLKYAQRVVLVPGYGLATAQAQHACHELEKLLEAEGVQFNYGIHPVAGRMPGHMNVLLAEAQVSYEKLLELEPVNEMLESCDIALVIGANDVVNPAAKESPGSPIFGMPIIEVAKAKTVVVFKRSMNPGYAGIDNPLFYKDNTRMLFGDAKESLTKLKAEISSM